MRKQYVFIILLIALGYMIITPILILAGAFNGSLNLYIRIIESGLLLLVILFSIGNIPRSNSALLPLIGFFLIYFLRLVNDVLLEGILMIYQTPLYVMGYFLGLTLLPVLAIAILYRPSDICVIHSKTFTFLVFANIALFIFSLATGASQSESIFSGRIQESGDLESSATLGPIWIGMAGSLLASMLIGIYTFERNHSMLRFCVGSSLLFLCAANILFGASRGPLLALMLVVLVLLFRPGTRVRKYMPRASRTRLWVVVAWTAAIAASLITISDGPIFLIERISSLYTYFFLGGGFEERALIYEAAWRDFLSSPFIGSSYVVSYKNSSPHNIVLESLMSTGLIGSSLLVAALYKAARSIQHLLLGQKGAEGASLALVTICSLVVGLTSSSIGQSPSLWIFVALTTVMGASNLPSSNRTWFLTEKRLLK